MGDATGKKSNEDLLAELGVDTKPVKKAVRTPREERIIAGFEEIQRFVDEHGRAPQHGEENDIFERLYATRLDRLREQEECRQLVVEFDYQNLLTDGIAQPPADYKSDDEILADLGVDTPKKGDVTFLKHVKPRAEVRAAEEIANRTPCADFEAFKPLFDAVQSDLESGLREAKLLSKNAKVNQGDWFILQGQKVYVAELSDERTYGFDGNDYRLRVIYDNATESDLLLRSLQRALEKDETGRRIIELSAGPLFDDVVADDDQASGTIYVLRSQSELPVIAERRDLIHKIGVTGGKVEKRIANAKQDATYLLSDVEVVATYKLANINRTKLEKLLHRFFQEARLDIKINDRFGNPVTPREWFLVPIFIIDEVVDKIRAGTLANYRYDVQSAALVERGKD